MQTCLIGGLRGEGGYVVHWVYQTVTKT